MPPKQPSHAHDFITKQVSYITRKPITEPEGIEDPADRAALKAAVKKHNAQLKKDYAACFHKSRIDVVVEQLRQLVDEEDHKRRQAEKKGYCDIRTALSDADDLAWLEDLPKTWRATEADDDDDYAELLARVQALKLKKEGMTEQVAHYERLLGMLDDVK